MDFRTADRLTLAPVAVILEHIHIIPALINLMKWISKHFKMDAKFADVVDVYVKHVYDLTVYDIKNKKKDIIYSDLNPN